MFAKIEAILYAAGEDGVDLVNLAQILGLSVAAMRQQMDAFITKLTADADSGLCCRLAGAKYYLLTKPETAATLRQYFQGPPATGLSQAALEVLAIIAYKQPVTRIEIDEIRGVQSSGSLQTLVTRQLVGEAGRLDAPGRPIMYATTPEFLDYFGLKHLSDLPPLPETGTAPADPEDLFSQEPLFTDSGETENKDE